jgi:hypothetical protein
MRARSSHLSGPASVIRGPLYLRVLSLVVTNLFNAAGTMLTIVFGVVARDVLAVLINPCGTARFAVGR